MCHHRIKISAIVIACVTGDSTGVSEDRHISELNDRQNTDGSSLRLLVQEWRISKNLGKAGLFLKTLVSIGPPVEKSLAHRNGRTVLEVGTFPATTKNKQSRSSQHGCVNYHFDDIGAQRAIGGDLG